MEGKFCVPPHKISPLWVGKFYVTTHIKFPLHGRIKMSFCVVISQTDEMALDSQQYLTVSLVLQVDLAS